MSDQIPFLPYIISAFMVEIKLTQVREFLSFFELLSEKMDF